MPIFVLTTRPPTRPPQQDDRLTFTFVGDGIAAAVSQAQTAAGTKDVQVVGGTSVIPQAPRAGHVEVERIDVSPVRLGGGLRLLDHLDPDRVRLETLGGEALGRRTSLRFRVVR